MTGQLSIAYPWYFLVLCALTGIAVAAWLYYRDRLLAGQGVLRTVLFTLRALAVSILAFLLLGPLWKGWITRTEQPLLIFLEDRSESVSAFTPEAGLAAYREGSGALVEALERDFEVIRYGFGAGLLEPGSPGAQEEKSTDIAAALNGALERHSHQHVGAVILASDGIFNQGVNPLYAETGKGTSVYTIALGDSTRRRDLFVQALQYPSLVYLGDKFQLDAGWGSYEMAGSRAGLRITGDDGREWLNNTLDIPSDEAFGRERTVIDADRPGVRAYTVQVFTDAEDGVPGNNRQTAYVEVLDGRKRVLLVYASPHPDVGALRAVIEGNKNYEVEVAPISRLESGPEDFDLVILHGLPDRANGPGSEALLRQCRQLAKPVAFIVTGQTDLDRLNDWQSVLRIDLAGGAGNEVQGLLNPDFRDFRVPEGLGQYLRYYPPLVAPFADYIAGPQARVIVAQRLGDLDTGYPLIVAGQEQGAPVLLVAGEGLWRWRMAEFARQGSSEVFDGFIGQVVQYITVSDDKRKFRLYARDNLIWENEAVWLNAELYNANYELINQPDVPVVIRDGEGNDYTFAMDRTVNGYALNAGLLPVGNYTARATTVHAGETLESEARFTVREMQLELLHRQADHSLLYNLSAATGGKFYTPEKLGDAAADIRQDVNLKPVLYRSETTTSLMRFGWIFLVVLGLLTAEWIVRKWSGAY